MSVAPADIAAPPEGQTGDVLVNVKGLTVSFDSVRGEDGVPVPVVSDVDFTVRRGEIHALIGPNGSGKTTCINLVSGLYVPTAGRITFLGHEVQGTRPNRIARGGMARTFQNIRLFRELTVWENLRMGAVGRRGDFGEAAERVVGYFPWIERRRDQASATLSGGEQQMLALARALVGRPRLLMLDEPSLGLAPTVVRELFATVRRLNEDDGLTVLVVEQNARIALDVASRAYVLEVGKVAVEGSSDELARHERVRKSYLGY